MVRRINLNSPRVRERQRQVQTYGNQTPLSSTAVERGSTRWLNGSVVVIEGLLDVTGQTEISGALNVSGTTTLSGATTIAGPTGITGELTIAGQLDVTGPTTLAGTLDIAGDTTLTGSLDVAGGGKITVGNTILSPSAGNGGVEFVSGGGIGGNAGGVVMRGSANSGFLALADTTASMFAGATQLNVSGEAVDVYGRLNAKGQLWVDGATRFSHQTFILAGLLTTTAPPNLYIDPSTGYVRRSTWTPA